MLRSLAVFVACVLFLSLSSAMATADDNGKFVPVPAPPALSPVSACAGLPPAELAYCRGLQISRRAPCTGTVEERLICLEQRLAFQEREITMLRSSIEDMSSPRIRPLTAR